MLTRLTKEQESNISFYFKKWHDIGHKYKKINQGYAKELLLEFVSIMNIKPKYFLFFDSPMACELAMNILKNFGNQLDNELRNQLYNQLDNQLCNQLDNELRNQLDNQLRNQLRNQLCNQLDNQLHNQLYNQLRNKKLEYFPIYYWSQSGNIISGYCAFYDYIESELIQLDKKTKIIWENFKKVQSELHYFWVFRDFIFCSEKPLEINFNKNDMLHADLKPSVIYNDGYAMYRLNGIDVGEKIVITPADKLDIKEILKINNVDVRAQALKKLGVERFQKELKEINKKDDYVLYDMGHLFDGSYMPVLKMKNPSVPLLYHFEYVHPDCKTVEQAINWRYSGKINKPWNPYILT